MPEEPQRCFDQCAAVVVTLCAIQLEYYAHSGPANATRPVDPLGLAACKTLATISYERVAFWTSPDGSS